MGQDIYRVCIIYQGVQAVAGRVLDLEFVADARSEFCIGAGGFAQSVEFIDQCSMTLTELCDADAILGIESGTVSQDHAHAGQGAVAVLRRTTTHTRRIVGGNAADFAGMDRGGIRSDLAAVRSEPGIDLAANDARPNANRCGIGRDFAGGETFANECQYAVGDTLTRQAGTGCAKGYRPSVNPCGLQQCLYFLFGFDDGDDLGNHAVETRIRSVSQATQVVRDNSVSWQYE